MVVRMRRALLFRFIGVLLLALGITLLNSLPKVALGPVIIIWMGANTKSIIFMALLINLIINVVTIYNGFASTDKIKIKLMNTFNASKIQTLLS